MDIDQIFSLFEEIVKSVFHEELERIDLKSRESFTLTFYSVNEFYNLYDVSRRITDLSESERNIWLTNFLEQILINAKNIVLCKIPVNNNLQMIEDFINRYMRTTEEQWGTCIIDFTKVIEFWNGNVPWGRLSSNHHFNRTYRVIKADDDELGRPDKLHPDEIYNLLFTIDMLCRKNKYMEMLTECLEMEYGTELK